MNGSGGIAVGMATNIPPHNLGEAIDATIVAMIDNPDISMEELMRHHSRPGFPHGRHHYGRVGHPRGLPAPAAGSIRVRAKAEIEEHGRQTANRIIVTEIPYQVNKATPGGKNCGARARQARGRHFRPARRVRPQPACASSSNSKRDVNANVVLNHLYKHTQMQDTFGVIMLALVDGEPQACSTYSRCSTIIWNIQKDVIVAPHAQYELDKAKEARPHLGRPASSRLTTSMKS